MPQETQINNELVVRIPEGLRIHKDKEEQSQKFRSDQFDLLDKLGVRTVVGYRHTDYGFGQIHSLIISDQDFRNKILSLFHNPALYAVLPKILQCIYQLGLDADDEIRYFTSQAITALSKSLSFSEIMVHCIHKWANFDVQDIGKSSAARALASMLDSQHKGEILQLLNHWSGSTNLKLVSTAITTFHLIHSAYPEETLAAIRSVVLTKNTLLTMRAASLLDQLYQTQAEMVIEHLTSWFSDDTADTSLQSFSADALLVNADVEAIAYDKALCTQMVEMIYSLWENGMANSKHIWQKKVSQRVKYWATTILTSSKTVDDNSEYRQFFVKLDQKYTGADKNRLRIHLARWQKEADVKDARLPEEKRLHLDFFSLVDDS